MSVSAVQQNESALCIRISPLNDFEVIKHYDVTVTVSVGRVFVQRSSVGFLSLPSDKASCVSHSLALGVMDSGAELAHSFHLFRWFPGCGSAGLPLRADSRVLSHCGSVLVFTRHTSLQPWHLGEHHLEVSSRE